ncbi:MAG: membrane protein [Bacteroidales bacterium]
MGGIGIGMRSNKQINPMNPASYSGTDSLTFIFDFGVAGQLSWFNDGINTEHHLNGNVEYMAMQFPIHRRIAVSAGILPYSYVGYNFQAEAVSADDISYTEQFVGKGGLNELYGGLSIDLWKKHLSVGANIGYLFGNIRHYQVLLLDVSTGTSRNRELEIDDIKADFGILYTHPVSINESYTLGLTFAPAKKINATSSDIIQNGSSSMGTDTVITTNQAFDLPNSFGAGLSYIKQNKLTLGADFLYEDWSGVRFFDAKNEFKNRIRIAAGGEFIPNHQDKAFFHRVKYRAGLHYSNSYLKINNASYDELGGGIGLGLPLVDGRSYLNLSFEYVKIKPETRSLIDEQYFRFTVNYTFNERWFFKFKVD